ncbi:glutamyl-tRNA reductase [Tunicatimonas pelagia]|uniref:glutamyl-tRNA reductase n=1 Tax=Tunicatimonas pelagia TaxID=931531 RepID=UPI0026653778|nr:glutamyl-tRNA reductase [Tunicatimonas pelagia]WKN43768.1 glutamyl-tRNA reductase [Tunicatimonas pelagia]
MHHLFKAISLTYKNSPVEVREQVALSSEEANELLGRTKELTDIRDVLILSTCNRTEIYYSHEENLSDLLVTLLGLVKGFDNENTRTYNPYFTRLNNSHSAMRHLFQVAVGLESQVIGDLQITNQVKRAYQASADADMAGPFLHRLLHTVFYSNKRVVQETAFRDGAASISYAATEMVQHLTGKFSDPQVLLIGLGEIGADVAKNLGDSKHRKARIAITNRTRSKAEELATAYDFTTYDFADLSQAISASDIIISSVGMAKPLLTHNLLSQISLRPSARFIDLSVPRSIEPAITKLPSTYLYNIDDIRNRADQALSLRLAAVPDVKFIIEESLRELQQWAQEMEVSPTIQRLKNALEQIRQEEMARYLKDVDDQQAAHIEKITRSMMQKIIKLPVLQLKAACKRGEAETLIDVLNDLFDLEKHPAKRT